MREQNRLKIPILLVFLLPLIAATPAYAYLDPGTGSLIFQGGIAILLTIAATGKIWWGKLKKLFRSGSAPAENDGK